MKQYFFFDAFIKIYMHFQLKEPMYVWRCFVMKKLFSNSNFWKLLYAAPALVSCVVNWPESTKGYDAVFCFVDSSFNQIFKGIPTWKTNLVQLTPDQGLLSGADSRFWMDEEWGKLWRKKNIFGKCFTVCHCYGFIIAPIGPNTS